MRAIVIQLGYRPYFALAHRVADLCEIAQNDELFGLLKVVLKIPS